jgi:preprotein translocase subunit SecB
MNMTAHTHVSLSPLRLNRYFLKSLNFSLYEGFDWGVIPEGVKIAVPALDVGAFSSQNPDNDLQWRVELNLNLLEPEEKNFPYKIDATLIGYFTVDKRYPKEDAERLARTAGPAFLYSTARDMLNAITNRSPFAPLILQSAVFSLKAERPRRKRLGASQPKRLTAKPKPTRKIAVKK